MLLKLFVLLVLFLSVTLVDSDRGSFVPSKSVLHRAHRLKPLVVSKHDVLSAAVKDDNFKIIKESDMFAGLFVISSVAVSLSTAHLVLLCKKAVAVLDTTVYGMIPRFAPLIGSLAVCSFYALDNNLGVNPFTLPLIVNKTRTRYSSASKGGSQLASEFMRFESHKMKGGKSFSILRQLLRVIATLIVLGTGCSLGLTAAAAEIGMTIAHLAGYFLPVVKYEPLDGSSDTPDSAPFFDVSDDQIKQNLRYRTCLLLAGAAAGVATNFNAPLAGFFYALEVSSQLLSVTSYQQLISRMSWSESSAGGTDTGASNGSINNRIPKLIATVGASALLAVMYLRAVLPSAARPILAYLSSAASYDGCAGSDYSAGSLLLLPRYSWSDWVYFLSVGCLGASLAGMVSSLRTGLTSIINAVVPADSRPLLAGLYCSLWGQTNRVSFLQINQLFSATNDIVRDWISAGILMSKLVSFVVCSSSGLLGGHMAPALFIGSAMGALLHVFSYLLPSGPLIVTPSLGVMLGGTAFISAYFRAPMTAVLLLLELTHSHPQRVLVPLMVTSLVAYALRRG